MNIQFLLFYMMFYIDVHMTYSIYAFIYTNLFKMESIVLPIKSSVAYNEENIKMLYFTNFQLAIYTLTKVIKNNCISNTIFSNFTSKRLHRFLPLIVTINNNDQQ